MQRLNLYSLAAQDISSPLLIATYTADADRQLLLQVLVSGVAGSGVYRACMTKQLLGAGVAYQSATSGTALEAGVATAYLSSMPIPVQATDVVKVYVQGLAGDTSVATKVEVFDVTAATTDEVWDELLAGHLVAGSTGKALSDAGSAGDPWAAAVRTLTSSAAATLAAVTGDTITQLRGDTWSISITGLGDMTTMDKLWFTVKSNKHDADSASIIQIEDTGNLLYLNGAAPVLPVVAADGTITVDNAALGNITITVKPAATALLALSTYSYDIQQLTAAGAVQTMTTGTLSVSEDYTRAIA